MKARWVWAAWSGIAGLTLAAAQATAAENNAWNRAHGTAVAERQPVFTDPVLVTNPPATLANPAQLSQLVDPRLVTNPAVPSKTEPSGPSSAGPLPASWGQGRSMTSLDSKHKLGFGYRIGFRVLEDQELPTVLTVTDAGELEVPELGLVSAVGKTCKELAYEIQRKLEQTTYYHATVLIGLHDIGAPSVARRIFVTGYVQRGGQLELPGGEPWTVSKAVIRAGGILPRGDAKRVKVTRGGRNGTPSVTYVVNVDEVWSKGRTEKDLAVEAEDTIYVPRETWSF